MENENKVLECTLPMRRYILKTKQSAWVKNSRRIIISSPCLVLPLGRKAEFIPVLRHYGKQHHQDVRFISTNDIEKDSCAMYKSERVEIVPKSKSAHGVVIVDSLPGHDFSYKRGDKLWLNVEPQKPAEIGTSTVPVINLRTLETGSILTQHVCWYPLAKGPLGELWTFGGMVSLVRGKKKQKWIWAIIQSRERKATVCDLVQLTSECEVKPSERVSLFKSRLELMEHQLKEESNRVRNLLPTSYLFMLRESPRQPSSTGATKRIFDSMKGSMGLISTLQTGDSSSSSARQPSSPPTKRRKLSPSTTLEVEGQSVIDLQPDSHLVSNDKTKPDSSIVYKAQLPTVESVSWAFFSSKPLHKPFLAVDEIARDPTIISAAYQRVRQNVKSLEGDKQERKEMKKLATFCSNRNPKCLYTDVLPPRTRQPHIHLPPSKCQLARLESHFHCVTMCDFPASPRYSGCLLANWPNLLKDKITVPHEDQHTCCGWQPENLAYSTHNIEMEEAKDYVHPSARAIVSVTSKGIVNKLEPKLVNLSEYTKHPGPTQEEVDSAQKVSQFLIAESKWFKESYIQEKPKKTESLEPFAH